MIDVKFYFWNYYIPLPHTYLTKANEGAYHLNNNIDSIINMLEPNNRLLPMN
jgi:hypothetical protein